MGIWASKHVEETLTHSHEFHMACNSIYKDSVSLCQHLFPGILPYQLSDASNRLHQKLKSSLSLIQKWVPLPPSQVQINRALKKIEIEKGNGCETLTLTLDEFKALEVELFRDAVVFNAGKMVLQRVPIGIGIIWGLGIGTGVKGGLMRKAMAVYSVGVAGSVYLSLSG
ncbi:hypothetical protein AMTRI_Chr06g200690 [Amborella trichopoda]